MIYFLRSQCANGFIKIGIARDLEPRINGLQAGSPYRLKLVRVLAGGRREERALHKVFAADHYRGEWYRPSEALIAFLISTRSQCLGSWASAEPYDQEKRLAQLKLQEFRAADRIKRMQEAMVGTTGIEPVTPAMSRRCSPAELRARSSEPEELLQCSDSGRNFTEGTSMSKKRTD